MKAILPILVLLCCTACNSPEAGSSVSNQRQFARDTAVAAPIISAPAHASDSALENISAVSDFLWGKRTLTMHEISSEKFSSPDSFLLRHNGQKMAVVERVNFSTPGLPGINIYKPIYEDVLGWPVKTISTSELKLTSSDLRYITNTVVIEISGHFYPLNVSHLKKIGELDDTAPDEMVKWPEVYSCSTGKRKYLLFVIWPLQAMGSAVRIKWIYILDVTNTSNICYQGFSEDFLSVESFDDRNKNGFADIGVVMRWVKFDTAKYVYAKRINYFDLIRGRLVPLKNTAGDSVFADVAFPISNYPTDIVRDSCILIRSNK